MTEPQFRSNPHRFASSKKLIWIMSLSCIGLCFLSLVLLREAAVPILSGTLPAIMAACLAWSGITNWAEVRRP